MRKSTIRKAFTLVEILIVVVILGILAAIVVPQFTSATQDSQAGNIKSQLGTLQRQIELYYAKNNSYAWRNSTTTAATNWGWSNLVSGNLIKEAPSNPAGTLSSDERKTVGESTTAGVRGLASCGWVWNTVDNRIYASHFNETTGAVSATVGD